MLFQSQIFLLVFLPVVLGLWYGAARHLALREWVLVACSLVFYGWWDVRFVPLLLGQVFIAWGLAQIYIRTGRRSTAILWFAIVANLSVLVFFKYWVFLAGNLAALTGADIPAMSVLLPIGISFYTFEIVSYLADLGWRAAPAYPLRRFALFVMMFPRLIAGPIVRHHEIIPQFDIDPCREGLAERLSRGTTLLVIGLVKKVFLADPLASIADGAFSAAAQGSPGFVTAWTGALAFTFQLFLDFSAYSDMAIGIALMLGFTLPQNFDAPYRALDLRDFWRRWHMTLSRYLRDYVYIPLGGSRSGASRFVSATLFTMGLCGLWHGAGWTYVVWGLMHGLGLIAVRAWQRLGRPLPQAVAWVVTFLFVVAGWVLFRAPDFAVAGDMLGGMVGLNGSGGNLSDPLLIGAAAAVSILGPTSRRVVLDLLRPQPAVAVLTAVVAIAVILQVGAGQPASFIYFQF